ncbi:hypothetical protein [Marinospirillum insulare]|uniref:DUF2946 domain-containing protein n=1 Tax=Marinospirillum insulare TaxID=217169 RepID=A0ABQ6A064_9GAMM|nr:hypothetical protein [Marinospirillum insulare]GLR64306.1 hypothetical protein GCM10007878_17440 [Marinospirillum insulare]
MLIKRPLFNTLMLLLALLVITQRVITPFLVAPIQVHANGYIEVCAWHGGFEKRLIATDTELSESLQPFNYCPACLPALATSSLADLDYLSYLPIESLLFTSVPNPLHQHPNLFTASPRAPPLIS